MPILAATSLAALAAACGDTAIVVTVDSAELQAPEDVDTLDVLVAITPEDGADVAVYELGLIPISSLPYLFALERVGAPLGSATITANGFRVGTIVAAGSALSAFQDGAVNDVNLLLAPLGCTDDLLEPIDDDELGAAVNVAAGAPGPMRLCPDDAVGDRFNFVIPRTEAFQLVFTEVRSAAESPPELDATLRCGPAGSEPVLVEMTPLVLATWMGVPAVAADDRVCTLQVAPAGELELPVTYAFTPRTGTAGAPCAAEAPITIDLRTAAEFFGTDIVCPPRPPSPDADPFGVETTSSRFVSVASTTMITSLSPTDQVLEEDTPLFGTLGCAATPEISTRLPLLSRTPVLLEGGAVVSQPQLCNLTLYTDDLVATPYALEVSSYDFDTCVPDRAGDNRSSASPFDLIGGAGFRPSTGGSLGPLAACRSVGDLQDDFFIYFFEGSAVGLQFELRFKHYFDGDLDVCVTTPSGVTSCARSTTDDERFTVSNPMPGLYSVQVFCDRAGSSACGNVYELSITPTG